MKLTDTQNILLSAAAARDSGSLLPLPVSIKAPAGAVAKSLASLINKGCIEKREVTDTALVHRVDGDLPFGLFITDAGKQAIGVDPTDDIAAGQENTSATANTEPAPARQTKAALVLALLQRDEGASLDELIAATGWLPHTTRAALTGLRKKGHEVARAKIDGVTRYSVTGAA